MHRRQLLTFFAASSLGCAAGTEDLASASARRGVATEGRQLSRAVVLPFAPAELRKVRETLLPLHPPRGAKKPDDWLTDHPERGQTLDQYLDGHPTVPTETRRTIVVMPLGAVDETNLKVIDLVADYLRLHFGLPVRVAERLDVEVPPFARRSKFGSEQFLTRWFLERLLPSKLPDDAAALIGLTPTDLWPGGGWNYVFGEASLTDRVGVWSLHRYGDPKESPAAFKLALLRALKIAAHETGHMFSLEHCIRYPCLQAGTNSLDETDESPLWLCPDCLPKIAFATKTDPRERLRQVAGFCKEHGFATETAFLERSLTALG